MKRFSEQFRKQSESIHLRASERKELQQRLVSYMEYHPMPASSKKAVRSASPVIVSEPFFAIKLNSFYVRSFTGAFAMFLILAVPVIAEKSVPGDVLYPVKVQFNEELRSSLSLSPYAKVAWETERLERRLSEARLLANEGKLTEKAESQVAEAVKSHSDAAQREIAQLRESNSDKAEMAEIAFSSALAVQSEVLEGHIEKNEKGDENETSGGSVVALAQVVEQARESARASEASTHPSYDKLLGWVETESTHVYELFASVQKDASQNEISDVERRLSDIERKVAQAVALKEGVPTEEQSSTVSVSRMMVLNEDADNEDADSEEPSDVLLKKDDAPAAEPEVDAEAARLERETEAASLLRAALVDIQKLLNYMTHIDVRENVSIEELVPLSPTSEEKREEIMQLLNETLELQVEIGAHELDQKVQAKVAGGQADLEVKISAAVAALEQGRLEEASAHLDEAHSLATDLARLTRREPLKTAPVLEETSTSTASTTETQQ